MRLARVTRDNNVPGATKSTFRGDTNYETGRVLGTRVATRRSVPINLPSPLYLSLSLPLATATSFGGAAAAAAAVSARSLD